MANVKEAIAIVLDVGPSMNQAPPGGSTFLQTSIDAVNAVLQRKLFAESKDEVTLVLCGTTNTANDLADGDSYENITLARPLGVANWELLEYLHSDVQPSQVSGDFLDAIVVAMDQLVKGIEGKRGFTNKRLILLSDVGGEFGDDQIDDIVASLKEAEIEFNVIGPSLDDEDDQDAKPKTGARNGVGGKEKTAQQQAGEAMLKHIIDAVDGDCYSFAEALPALAFFQSRTVRSVAWKAQLEIGTSLQIPVSGYQRMKEAKAKSFKNVYAKDIDAPIERIRTYHLNDEDRTEIEKEDTVEGHRYGSTLVPFSSDDKEAFKFQTEKCLKVLGFTKMENVRKQRLLGDYVMAFTSEKGDQAAAVALSAFINAMYETNTCAIVRRVYAKNSRVQIGCLVPHIKAKYECMFFNEIPYAEDIRQYTFSSLPLRDDIEVNKKLKPSDEQLDLMDEFISSMDLIKADKDADGESREALKPKLTFNPYLQRLYQCLQHRAMNPDDPLPELNAVIANYLKPPKEVQTQCEPVINKMKEKFKLVHVEKTKKDEAAQNIFKDDKEDKAKAEPAAKKAKLDDDLGSGMADLVKNKVVEVGSVTPVEDFKAMVADKEQDRFEEACKQMQKQIIQIVMDSFGAQLYGKAMDCLKVLREQCIQNTEPSQFNLFLKELKSSVCDKGRKDFLEELVSEKVSLISKTDCEQSEFTKEESERFLILTDEDKPENDKKEDNVDDQDLLDEF